MVLMSRSQEKLDKVATEISKKLTVLAPHMHTSPTPLYTHTHTTHSTEARYAGREVRVVPVDFSQGAEIFPQIAESVQDLDIGILGQYTQRSKIFIVFC